MSDKEGELVRRADVIFDRVAADRNHERLSGIKRVRSVYGAEMPHLGHYKVR